MKAATAIVALLIIAALAAVGGNATPAAAQGSATDYDADNDGLIEVSNLAQLDAIRYDVDDRGHGRADGRADDNRYAAAFPDAAANMGCPTAGCTGYELVADLDFDTNGNGQADAGDAYWNDGKGWQPIWRFGATFDGGGHTIANLFFNVGLTSGLFATNHGVIRNVSLVAVNVTGDNQVGSLVGHNTGIINDSNGQWHFVS